MLVKKIISGIVNHHEARQIKKAEKKFVEADKLLLKNHPEYVERRQRVEEFLNSPCDFASVKTGYENTSLVQLSYRKVDDVISSCNDDPAKILKLTGLYGISYYTGLPVNKLKFPNLNAVKEVPYQTGRSIDGIASEYLLKNDGGTIEDFSYRFGDIGDELFDHFRKLGFTKTWF